jgi:hypothetical protein
VGGLIGAVGEPSPNNRARGPKLNRDLPSQPKLKSQADFAPGGDPQDGLRTWRKPNSPRTQAGESERPKRPTTYFASRHSAGALTLSSLLFPFHILRYSPDTVLPHLSIIDSKPPTPLITLWALLPSAISPGPQGPRKRLQDFPGIRMDPFLPGFDGAARIPHFHRMRSSIWGSPH